MDSSRHRASSGGTAKFPVPADFFAPVVCNDAQAAVLQAEADKIVRDTVRTERWETQNDESLPGGWKLASSRKHFRDMGVRTYTRKPDAQADKKSRRQDFKCMSVISMPLDQAMDALYSDNTSDLRHNLGTLLENCLDAAVLHVIRRKSDTQPQRYLGINWIALRGASRFSKKRDVCYLKSIGTTFDEKHDEVGYIVTRSIDVKECPPLDKSLGLVRTNISAILLLKEMPDGRSTSVIWQGTMPISKSSSPSKVLDFVHNNFMSCIGNLNVFTVTRYLARETDLERFVSASRDSKCCHLCNKKFSLLRSRHHCHACGENMCRDCEVKRKTTALDRETLSTNPSFAEKSNVRRYCKKCMVTARKKAEDAQNKPVYYDFTRSTVQITDSTATTPVAADKHAERMSAVSSTGSHCSIQLTWPDLSKNLPNTGGAYYSTTPSRPSFLSRQSFSSTSSTPTYSTTRKFTSNLSSSQVPVSPLTIKTKKTHAPPPPVTANQNAGRRERLETDPWEYYDAFVEPEPEVDARKSSVGGRGSTYSNGRRDSASSYNAGGRTSYSSDNGRSSTYSNDGGGVEMDLAARLWEMSRMAQETLDTTRRNSCMMSETGSAPRSSEQFQHLDRSIAEQADLLNVIGFVSTGRVYMDVGEDEHGEHSGVRISETSIDEEERFEILT